MIATDAATLERSVTAWEREIVKYVKRYKDNMTSRNVIETRDVGADVAIDVVTSYDRTGPGAQITAKGAVPKTAGVEVSDKKHDIYQISVAFQISQKDMKLDPKTKNRLIDITMRDIHRKEDEFAILGEPLIGRDGITTTAQNNINGRIVAAGASGNDTNNEGAWSGVDGTEDPYADINTALGKMDDEFEPAFLLGRRTDLLHLNRMDSERNPFWKSVSTLFDKGETSKSWMWTTSWIPQGKVYLIPKDFMAAELVVSENARIDTLYNGGMGPGKNYYFEVGEWVVPEFHNADAFVEIDIM